MDKQAVQAKMAMALRKFRDAHAELSATWGEYDRIDGDITFQAGYPFVESFDDMHVREWCNHYISRLEGTYIAPPEEERGFPPIAKEEVFMVYDKLRKETLGDYSTNELVDHFGDEDGWHELTVGVWAGDEASVGDEWESATLRITRIE
jgi:hypothetical protein